MTQHRCQDKTWRAGKAKDCPTCKAVRQPRSVKRVRES